MFGAGPAEIDAGRFDAFVAHQVGQQRDVPASLEEALRETVPERVRIHDGGIDLVFDGQRLQVRRDAARGDARAAWVLEQESAFDPVPSEPVERFRPQGGRNVDAPELSALRVEVQMSQPDVFQFELEQFPDPRARRSEKADDEIPPPLLFVVETLLEIEVIRLADNVLKERLLLDADERDFQIRAAEERQVGIDGQQIEVDGLGLPRFHGPSLEQRHGLGCQPAFLAVELPDGAEIGSDRVAGFVRCREMRGEVSDSFLHGGFLDPR